MTEHDISRIIGCSAPLTLLLLILLATGGADRPGAGVRISFCLALALTHLPPGSRVEWREQQAWPAGYEDLRVRLRFVVGGQPAERTAVCAYPYRAVEENALTLAEPLAADGTAPTAMEFDDRALSQAALPTAVRDALERVRTALDPPPRP